MILAWDLIHLRRAGGGVRNGLIGMMFLMALVGCERPADSSAPNAGASVYAPIWVPSTYFPLPSNQEAPEMRTLTVQVMADGSQNRYGIHLPDWMNGEWAISGSSMFDRAAISAGRLELHTNQTNQTELPVISASFSPLSGLLAIHTGLDGFADTDTLYAGYLVIKRKELSSGEVQKWSFTQRSVGYGMGLLLSDRERWTFTRIHR